MTVTVSFLIYTFCSSNHASTGGKVDCVYRVRIARARLELSVLSSFLKSQAEASRERKRKRSRSASSRWYLGVIEEHAIDSIVDEIIEKSEKAPHTYIGRMLDPLHSNEYSVLNS